MKIERLLVFGDIHGMWEKFLSAYEKVQFDPRRDMMIFLGDYLDRGKGNVQVMEWVLEHFGKPNMIFLRGNHDAMFYESLRGFEGDSLLDLSLDPDLLLWLANGGKATFLEIFKTGRGPELIKSWLQVIGKMPLYTEVVAEGHTYWFMHADCIPGLPLEEQPEETLLWKRHLASYPEDQTGEQTIVLGHTPVQSLGYAAVPQVLAAGRLVLMDTGSFLPTGRVSCLDLLSETVYQSE